MNEICHNKLTFQHSTLYFKGRREEEGSMRSSERQQIILNMVKAESHITLSQIKEKFPDISDITIRRDLEYMDKERMLVRIRGGAKSLESIIGGAWEDSYQNRLLEHADEKKKIAEKAVTLLKPKSSVFLDSGSTAFCMAEIIPDIPMDIMTSGITCALQLSGLKEARVQMLGGSVNTNSYSVTGEVSVDGIRQRFFSIAFLGVTGYMIGRGFVTTVADDWLLKKQIAHNCDKLVILMDSSKVGKEGSYIFAETGEADIVISDDRLAREAKYDLKGHGVSIL